MSLTLSVHVVIDAALVTPDRLDELIAKTESFGAVLEDVGTSVEQALADNFLTEGWGTWAPLADSTIRDRMRQGYQWGDLGRMLVRTGDLFRSLTQRDAVGHKFLVTGNSITVGVYGDVVPYASMLAEGTRRMPARILINITNEDIDRIIAVIKAWLGADVTVYADSPFFD